MDNEYDDSPWTREELQTLAWKAGEQTGWDEMEDEERDLLRLEACRIQELFGRVSDSMTVGRPFMACTEEVSQENVA